MMIDPMIAALWVVRLVQFAAVLAAFGAVSFRLYAANGLGGTLAVQEVFDRWLWQVLSWAAIVSLFSSIAWLFVQSALLGEGWASALTAETLSAVLFQTEFGQLWIGRMAIALALLVAMLFLHERKTTTAGAVLVAVLSLLLVASLAGTGHAVMASGVRRIADMAIQAVHLIAAALWLGGLLPLGYVLRKAQRGRDPAWMAAAQAVLLRYSLAGLLAVVSLVLTGLLISWSLVGNINALFRTLYGQLLLAKFGIFLLMVGLAVANRLNLTPKIVKAYAQVDIGAPLSKLWRNVALEQGLGIAILAMVSILGTLPPGDDVDDPRRVRNDYSPALGAIPPSVAAVFPGAAATDHAGDLRLTAKEHAS